MQFLKRGLAILAVAGLSASAGSGCAASAEAPEIWESITLAQARSLVTDLDGKVDGVGRTDEGGWRIDATFPGGMTVRFEGMSCKGEGETQACPEYDMSVALPTADEETAKAVVLERDVYWTADGYEGRYYKFWRMGFLYGGVTRQHMRNTLKVMLDMAWSAHAELQEKSKSPKGAGE